MWRWRWRRGRYNDYDHYTDDANDTNSGDLRNPHTI
jgi:hypothetical protein